VISGQKKEGKEWFKLLAHRSPAPYGTKPGVPAAKLKNQRVTVFLHIKKI
jgi:hypothetical protein